MTKFYVAPMDKERPEEGFMRHNDGSLVIMEADVAFKDADDEWTENVARLTVSRFTPAKRGQGWNTPDPEQEAFAKKVAAILNAGWEA